MAATKTSERLDMKLEVVVVDLLAAITMATIYNAPAAMGPAYWIPAFWVPLLLVTHYVTFVLLRRRWGS
jgi:hypothetical protein